ncbi:tricalbin [Laetiporus sulphureus 93-53]|uniref:Tricalbin n=1 Tax=Laetiporus sulphureus 93-53 TaxID=1314785 RepID=A0A165E5W1_9APHY|nr:tricalbin [Laetiporus sulphureus 93-53]KZT06296.1 tricalbin [Laetiporus sulphureus 93-53]
MNGQATSPETQAKVNGIVQDDAAKGRVAVHSFDPDMPPQEKAAIAGKEKEKLKLNQAEPDAVGKEVPVGTGNSNIVPTITIENVDEKANGGETPPTLEPQVPGSMPVGPAPAVPDWYTVGWREVSGIDTRPKAEDEEKDKYILQTFLSEQFYGDWYHNAALVVAVSSTAVVMSHYFTRFNFGWGWLLLLLAFCNTYYTTSMSRMRRRARDDIQRELVKTRLETEFESADWLNNFLDRFWLIYEPVLSQTIIASVDQILSTNCPTFLESLRLSTFTLGTKAPRVDKVKTSPRTEDDVVLMDWAISFTPNDTSDMTKRQIKDKVNPKIVLSVRVGKGIASATMPILLEDLSFSGILRVRMKLMTTFPHIQLVDLSFLEKPVIDWALKPIGGETFGFDISFIPGLSSFIRDTVHATLAPMMYAPNVFTLNLEQLLSGEPIDTAVGVIQVTVQTARGLKSTKIAGGTPDPYVSLSINNRAELARTTYKHDTSNPTWMETKFLLVNNLTESLVLSVVDWNEHRKDSEIGSAVFDMSKLREDSTQEGIDAPILKDGKQRGTIRFDVSFYPILKPEVDSGGKEMLPMDTKVGIARLTLHQAKELDHTKSMSNDLNPFVRVHLDGNRKPTYQTKKVKHTNNPVWESSTEFLCMDRLSSIITVKVIDDRDILRDPIIGYMNVRLDDLINASKEAGKDWWPLSSCKSGKMRLSVEWRPLNMPGSLHGIDQYVPPIGVVRLWLQKATDVKNVEAALGGKSDPYVRVQINNITQGRTEVWDQIIYIPVHSLKETMLLECMDYQHLTKDRSLGYVELKVSELAKPSKGDFLYASTGKKTGAESIKLDKGTYKGKLHFEAEFVPALPVKGIGFEKHANETQQAVPSGSEAEEPSDSRDSLHLLKRERTIAPVPEGVTASQPLGAGEKTDESSGAGTPIPQSPEVGGSSGTGGSPDLGKVEEHRPEEEGVELTKEELLKHQSGILICNVLSGELCKKARLEVLLDDAYWPAFSTVKPRSHKAQWEYIGEGFIKELDFGRVWLRLNEADEGDKDDIIAEWKGDAKPFLQSTMDGPTTFTLVDKDDADKKSTVQLEARYLPVPIKLEARESINNQGMLRVDILDGRDIQAVDRGGKSDPFVVFYLNGQKVYKSETKKKTLSPEWNENFMVQVPSRVAADFTAEVFDWNQIEQAKTLGAGKINLADIEPFQAAERTIPLSSAKHGEKGSIRIRLLFQPEIIVKTRKNTSTFSSAGRAMTQIGHIPVGVAVGAGRGVVHGVTGVFKSKDHAKKGSFDSDEAVAPQAPSGQASQPVGSPAIAASAPTAPLPAANGSPTSINGNLSLSDYGHEPGSLRVLVMDAKDMSAGDLKPYVVVRVGDKEYKTKHSHKTATPECACYAAQDACLGL